MDHAITISPSPHIISNIVYLCATQSQISACWVGSSVSPISGGIPTTIEESHTNSSRSFLFFLFFEEEAERIDGSVFRYSTHPFWSLRWSWLCNFSKNTKLYLKEMLLWFKKNQKKLELKNINLSKLRIYIFKLKVKQLISYFT